MLKHLEALQGFEQIDYYPHGQLPEAGQLAPDVTVTLALDDVETSGLPGFRKLNAQISFSASSTLAALSGPPFRRPRAAAGPA